MSVPSVDERSGGAQRIVGTGDRAHNKKSVDARRRQLREIVDLDAAAHNDRSRTDQRQSFELVETMSDDRAVGSKTGVGLGRRLVQRSRAKIIDVAHVGGLDVVDQIGRPRGEPDDRIGAEEFPADVDGNIGLPHVNAVDLHAHRASGKHHVKPIVDEQRDVRIEPFDVAMDCAKSAIEKFLATDDSLMIYLVLFG